MSRAAFAHTAESASPARSSVATSVSASALHINRPGDFYEQEADWAADQVVSNSPAASSARKLSWSLSKVSLQAPLQRECACGGECEDCKKDKMLQREATGATSHAVAPPIVQSVLSGAGRQLDPSARTFMESRFGHDFSRVRVFNDDAAADSARAVSANAYTVGEKIVFNQGKYSPDSASGRRLLAHELAHVVQQSRGGSAIPVNESSIEGEARQAACSIDHAESGVFVRQESAVGIAREAATDSQQLIEVHLPDGVKQLTPDQFAEYKRRAVNNLRVDLRLVDGLADNGRQSQQSMLNEYQGGVESLWDVVKKPKALIGIAADIKAGVTPPYIGAWSNSKPFVQEGLAACDLGDLTQAAHNLQAAEARYKEALHAWNAYREATIGGAEGVASNLETVRDISFAVALAAGAAVAAPVIAAGVASVGATGATATVLATAGTALATGTGGAVLGGGSTAVGSLAVMGKVDLKAVKEDAVKFGKQGVVTGLTAGLGTGLGAAAKGAKLAQPLIQTAAKRCVTEAGVSVAGEVTTQVLDAALPPLSQEHSQKEPQQQDQEHEHTSKPVLPGPARAALTGCLSGALGVPVAKLGHTGAKASELAVTGGVGYLDARLSGQSNKEALLAAGQGILTSAAISHGHAGSKHAKAQKLEAKTPQGAEPAAPEHRATAGAEETSITRDDSTKKSPAEKIIEQQKSETGHDGAPAILKEDAKAKEPVGNGHDAVVTEHGVGRCSPSPCPVIHLEYAKELEANPKLKAINDSVQGLRKTDPVKAAKKAAALIRTLEAIRENAPAAQEGSHASGPDRRTTRGEWKKQEGQRRWNMAVEDWAQGIDLEEHGSVSRVTGTEASGFYIDGKRVPTKQQSRLDLSAASGGKDVSIPLLEGESHREAVDRVETVIGKKISEVEPLNAMWESARKSVLEKNTLTSSNYDELYNKTRNAFWRRVRGHAGAMEMLKNAGFGFTGGRSSAPQLMGTGGALKPAETKVSLDHIHKKAQGDNWKKALEADNLRMEFAMPNTYREIIQARHPELRE